MKQVFLFLSLVVIVICASCEGYADYHGYLLDEETMLPIDSARVFSYAVLRNREELAEESYSDSTGAFQAGYHMRSCGFSKCPKLKIVIHREGYIPLQLESHELDTDTIYLQKG